MRMFTWVSVAAFLLLTACQLGPAPAGKAYLVRHAEKTLVNPDPGLTAAGHARADALADRLAGAGITTVWTTDYKRTRDTAAPIVERLGLEVKLYNPRDLEGFAAHLKERPDEIVLIVGHSNTTPQLVQALGGDPVSEINEAGEYDRLYVVDLGNGDSELMRYGAAYLPDGADAAGQ